MNKKQNTPARVGFLKPCVCPEVGDLLPDYIVELLSEEASAEVEQHLVKCGYCRKDYVKIMSMRAAAQEVSAATPPAAGRVRERRGAAVLRLSDYKK